MEALSFFEPVLNWLWRASWQGSVLVILVLTVQWLFRNRLNPQWSYALWLLVVVRLMLPISPESNWSLYNLAIRAQGDTVTATVAEARPPLPVIGETERFAANDLHFEPVESSDFTPPEESKPAPAGAVDPDTTGESFAWSWQVIFGVFWGMGVLVFGLRVARAHLQFARRLSFETIPLKNKDLLGLLDQCRQDLGLRRTPHLLETSLVSSPALFGAFRPKLLLPTGMSETFTSRDLRHIFLHELAHVRRGDAAINWVLTGLQVLHWFNPILWFAFRRIRADRELACDALALSTAKEEDVKSYGQTIVKVLESFTERQAMTGLVGILEEKNQMKKRIRMIASFRRSPRGYTLSMLLLVCLAAVALTDARQPDGPPAPGEEEEALDPTQPAPRDRVLDTLREKLALSAEDTVHWDEAVAAGRIPPNVVILREYLVARGEELHWDEIDLPPSVTLPDGREISPLPIELLGPNLGANVTQEDLNTLSPDLAEAQQRVDEYSRALNAPEPPDPLFAEEAPLEGGLERSDFAVTYAFDAERPGTVEEVLTLVRPNGGTFSRPIYVDPEPFIDGKHVRDVFLVYHEYGRVAVVIKLNEEGTKSLAEATRDLAEARDRPDNPRLALFVERELVSAPSVGAQVTSGSLELGRPTTEQEAIDLVNRWKGPESQLEIQLMAAGPVYVQLSEAIWGTKIFSEHLDIGDDRTIVVPADRPVRVVYNEAEHIGLRIFDVEYQIPGEGRGRSILPSPAPPDDSQPSDFSDSLDEENDSM